MTFFFFTFFCCPQISQFQWKANERRRPTAHDRSPHEPSQSAFERALAQPFSKPSNREWRVNQPIFQLCYFMHSCEAREWIGSFFSTLDSRWVKSLDWVHFLRCFDEVRETHCITRHEMKWILWFFFHKKCERSFYISCTKRELPLLLLRT